MSMVRCFAAADDGSLFVNGSLVAGDRTVVVVRLAAYRVLESGVALVGAT